MLDVMVTWFCDTKSIMVRTFMIYIVLMALHIYSVYIHIPTEVSWFFSTGFDI